MKQPESAWWNSPTSPTATPARVIGFVVDPTLVYGGSSAQATLTLQNVTAGTTLRLASSDAAVSVPSSVTASGSTVTFPLTIGAVDRELLVTLTAILDEQRYATTVTVWPAVANSLWFEPVQGGSRRSYTGEHATFAASCFGPRLVVRINGSELEASFSAAANGALRPGAYEGTANSLSAVRPAMHFGGSTMPLCFADAVGRFVIDEADLPPLGPVRRFVARFEQHCRNGAFAIRGEVRLTAPPPTATSSVACNQ